MFSIFLTFLSGLDYKITMLSLNWNRLTNELDNYWFLIIVLFLAVFLGIVFSISTNNSYDLNKTVIDNKFEVDLPEGQKKPSETVIFDGSQRYYFNERNFRKTFDCSTNESGCVETQLNKTYLECENVYPVKPNIEDSCVMTDDSDSVTIKSQARNNHVSAPLTEDKLKIEKSREILGENYQDIRDPWDLEIVNKNRFMITGQNGKLYDIKGGEMKVYDVDVKKTSPGLPEKGTYTGLMGVTTHPNFSENNQIYLFYSYDSANLTFWKEVTLSKVARFRLNREEGTLEKMDTIVDSIPGYKYYKGGRINFGPQNKHLYVTTGAPIPERAQNTSNLEGKILRLNPDGSIPVDNPFNNEVYAYGFRNPQGLDWNPETGNMVVSQHGPWRRDNVAKVGKGTNMGWPKPCERSHPNAEIGEEVLCTQTWTLAPSGITFVDNESHEWYEDLFIASLNGNHVHRMYFESGEATGNEVFWFNGFQSEPYEKEWGNRIRDVEFSNGKLWVLHNTQYLTILSPE